MAEKNPLTRRQFMKGTAVIAGGGVAVGVLGARSPAEAAAAQIPKKWNGQADVIVVGSGPTGLPAAVAAVDRGASVLLLEQSSTVGGCGVIAGGILNIGGGTRVQKLNKIEDSPDLLFQKLSNYKDPASKRQDPALLRAYCDYNPGIVDWLEDRGVRFMDSITRAGSGGSLHRSAYHHLWWDKEGPGAAFLKTPDGIVNGAGLIMPLEAYARKKGVKILLEHKMTRIIRQERTAGRVLGVEVQAGKKKLYFRAKKAVILGTGGWKGHKFLRALFDARITGDLAASGEPFVNPDGSGIQAAMEAGAVLMSDHAADGALFRRKFGTKHYNFPLNSPYGAPGLGIGGARMGDVILVNKAGARFVNEEDTASLGTFSFFDAALAQEGHVLWAIFDDGAAGKYKWDPKPPVTEKDCAFSAQTLVELARAIRVPEDAFVGTVRRYNNFVDAGRDTDFDRPKSLLKGKIETPPFHAVWISLYVHDTCGGLAVNAKAQVLDVTGGVIPGLYAGGEATGGIDVPGMPRGIILGRIAGENAAAG